MGLHQDRRDADVKGHIVLVDEPAGLPRHLAHHPVTRRAQGTVVVLADITRVVAHRCEDVVGRIRDQAVRPEEFCPRVEISGEFEDRIAKLLYINNDKARGSSKYTWSSR